MVDILLIEDNVELATLIEALLSKKGFSFYYARSGEKALEWLLSHKVKIIILDIMLEGIDGFAVCKQIKENSNIPILMLSAKTEKQAQLLGFELGADDYIEKPVDLDILSAKIKAILNRNMANEKVIISGAIKIEVDAHKAYLYDKLLDLNVKEFELLLLLVQNVGKTLHKSYLFQQIWKDSFSEDQTLTVHIKMLRSKIEDDSRNPKRIQTVWGIGYRYEEI